MQNALNEDVTVWAYVRKVSIPPSFGLNECAYENEIVKCEK